MTPKTTIYTIYTADEKVTMHHLLKHLKPEVTDNTVEIWYNDSIKAGQPWKPSDKSRLYDTDIFLLLISNTFMYSEFIKQLEFKIIIDRYKAGTSRVIPIILEHCPWDIDFEADDYTFNFNELQVLPEVGKPLKTWDSRDKALTISAGHVKKIIKSLTHVRNHELSGLSDTVPVVEGEIEDQQVLSFSEEDEAQIKVDEATRIREELAAQKEAEAQRILLEKAKEKQRAEEENWFRERMDTSLEAVGVAKTEFDDQEPEIQQGENNNRRRLFLGAAAVVLAIIGIALFIRNLTSNSEELSPQVNEDAIVVQGATVDNETKTSTTLGAGASMTMNTGDRFQNGIIFKIDSDGKNGIIAHVKDTEPMTWNDAMKIHEKLGEGWRLPTLVELKRMHRTIGQGATNSGKFTDGLYWSATPYDSNQARLIRFQDGNTTFHYNSIGTFRKFPVRAVRDFNL